MTLCSSTFQRVSCVCVWILGSAGANRVLGQGDSTLHWPRSQKQTVGVALTLEEVQREPGRRGTRISYRIKSSGFPLDKTYRLQVSGLSERNPTTWVTAIQVTETGSLAVGRVKNTPIDVSKLTLAIDNYNKGEFYMIEVISDDGAVYSVDRVYPFPIESRDRDCHVWAELLNKDRKSFGLTGMGFDSNTDVRWSSSEEGGKDTKEGTARVGPDGLFVAQVSHRKGGGIGSFTAAGQQCQVTLRYEFGKQAKGPQ